MNEIYINLKYSKTNVVQSYYDNWYMRLLKYYYIKYI